METPNGDVGGAGLEAYDRVVQVSTPIRFDGSSEVTGAFAIYQDYGPIAAHIKNVQRNIYISIAAALAFVYLTSLFVVKRGFRLTQQRQKDVHEQSQEVKNSYDSIVAVLCSPLDLSDQMNRGQAQRVSELTSVVAWQLGYRKEQVRLMEQAAILHDIGKIGLTETVLSKSETLTDEEWREMRRHPELGYRILKDIDFLEGASEIVYAHHERYDGTGYPRGLAGDEIPRGARVFAVVDAYDAMTTHRPYRKALPHNKAVEEIQRNSGTQFDPQVVQAFMEAERRGLIQGDNVAQDEVEPFTEVARQPQHSRPIETKG